MGGEKNADWWKGICKMCTTQQFDDDDIDIYISTNAIIIVKWISNQNRSKYSVCSYSKCGKYIAAGNESGDFSIWDIDANKLIQEDRAGDNEAQCITAIDWNPNNNGEFAYTDNTGQFGLIENILDDDDDDSNNILNREAENRMEDDIDYDGSKSRIFQTASID